MIMYDNTECEHPIDSRRTESIGPVFYGEYCAECGMSLGPVADDIGAQAFYLVTGGRPVGATRLA